MSEDFWGHSENGKGRGVPESLRDHSTRTATRAAEFAERLGIAPLAKAAGMLHDLGKCADQMQRRLKGASESGRDHWSVGSYALAGGNAADQRPSGRGTGVSPAPGFWLTR